MAGGFKQFGPTYNTTPYVRLGYEGILNGAHGIDPSVTNDLAGKFAELGTNGVKVAGAGGKKAVGLFREDLNDMQNASMKATFYFRGGEYYVAVSRTGLTDVTSGTFVDTNRPVSTLDDSTPSTPVVTSTEIAIGDEITCDNQGRIIKLTDSDTEKALGIVTYLGAYPAGNMYANAGTFANSGDFVGFILYI